MEGMRGKKLPTTCKLCQKQAPNHQKSPLAAKPRYPAAYSNPQIQPDGWRRLVTLLLHDSTGKSLKARQPKLKTALNANIKGWQKANTRI